MKSMVWDRPTIDFFKDFNEIHGLGPADHWGELPMSSDGLTQILKQNLKDLLRSPHGRSDQI